MIITLDVSEFQGWSEAERLAHRHAYVKAVSHHRAGTAGRVLAGIGDALTDDGPASVDVDLTGVGTRQRMQVVNVLEGFAQHAPVHSPPAWLTGFLRDLTAADAALADELSRDGKRHL